MQPDQKVEKKDEGADSRLGFELRHHFNITKQQPEAKDDQAQGQDIEPPAKCAPQEGEPDIP